MKRIGFIWLLFIFGLFMFLYTVKADGQQPTLYYDVKYETNGGSDVPDGKYKCTQTTGSDVSIWSCDLLQIPSDPTKAHSIFTGWYKDSMLTEKFDFDSTITDDIKLYAKWDCEDGYYPLNNGQMCFTYETISISDPNNPAKGFTMMDRNLGATATGAGDDISKNSFGYYYQWGNNRGFSTTGGINRINTQVNTTGYGPNNYYKSDSFVVGYYDWSKVSNPNLWGGQEVSELNIKGPCPDGYHIPSIKEWTQFFNYWYYKKYGIYIDALNGRGYPVRKEFAQDFLIPYEGFRFYRDGNLDQIGRGRLWSSSSYPNSTSSSYIFLNSDNYVSTTNAVRGYGFAVRCFADEYIPETVSLILKNDDIVETQKVIKGLVTDNPPDPTKEGYNFVGRYEEGSDEKFDFENTHITKDTILYAKFEISQFTITFDTVGGSDISPITQDYGTLIQAPENPTKEGYSFIGWDVEIPFIMPAKDIIITAKWEKKSSNWSGGGRRGTKKSEDSTGSLDNHGSADEEDISSLTKNDNYEIVDDLQNDNKEISSLHKRSYENGLTIYAPGEDAKFDQPLTRQQMAKISSIFGANFLGQKADASEKKIMECSQYEDLDKSVGNMKGYIIQSCLLGNMGYHYDNLKYITKFKPYNKLTVAEASVIISRMVWGDKYILDAKQRYQGHMLAVYEHELIDDISDPKRYITKGEALMMMYRLNKLINNENL